jgi:hypothetical protein
VTATGLRIVIGLVLAGTALGKLLDVEGFEGILRTYRAFGGGVLPVLAIGIPASELLLALWLFSGRRVAGAALTSLAMHLLYAAWSTAGLLRGLELPNCGCFGVFFARPLTWTTVLEDLVMATLSAWLLAAARVLRSRREEAA